MDKHPEPAIHKQSRYDIYALVHKGLRSAMGQTLYLAGRIDPDDEADLAALAQELEGLLLFCGSHVQHENDFIHTAMEARAPGSASRTADEHQDHLEEIAELGLLLERLKATPRGQRAVVQQLLYRVLAGFVAENYLHMSIEESHNNGVLWAHYSDAEIAGIEAALVASIPPEKVGLSMRWMLSAMSHGERCGFLGAIRAHAPAPAFEGLVGLARSVVAPRDFLKLESALQATPA
ncbi:hypothetical protein [Niveibacterium sp. SC-1]|uniref:hemerythrin domain-containing protein n=1 Tax=Niveibacterium sp. SC-1 TaxID=3135646 RepID=UPI00311F39C3